MYRYLWKKILQNIFFMTRITFFFKFFVKQTNKQRKNLEYSLKITRNNLKPLSYVILTIQNDITLYES